TLQRLRLTTVPVSRYRIRKAHETHQLSTLEATCAALAQLEGPDFAMQPLLEAFEGFVDQQLVRRPDGAAGRARINRS
ncbi:MAG: DTW domain-containing protein, partial [Comamonadaceae bacterium]